jgi:hypothetical protein
MAERSPSAMLRQALSAANGLATFTIGLRFGDQFDVSVS